MDSPAGALCKECDRGCRIYDERPEPCRAFNCLWLQQEQIPESLRPDRCSVMFELPFGCSVWIGHTEREDWGTAEVRVLIEKIKEAGRSVVVKCGSNKTFSLAPGQTRAQMHDEINAWVSRDRA